MKAGFEVVEDITVVFKDGSSKKYADVAILETPISVHISLGRDRAVFPLSALDYYDITETEVGYERA